MGRFHRHSDGTVHHHDHGDEPHHHHHEHDHTHSGEGHRDVGDHAGYETGNERVMVLEKILDENDRIADRNREELKGHGVRSVNLMSSPGAGKTTLLRKTLEALRGEVKVGVLEGDIATSIDADRLAGLGAEVSLVNTNNGFGGECHLDAVMVRAGLERLPLADLDLLVIENVGNLVCPAEFDVGQDARAMVFSVTEGEDKPLKYPVMFRSADVILVNKTDLLPHLELDMAALRENVAKINPNAHVFELSARTGEGLEPWLAWLKDVASAEG